MSAPSAPTPLESEAQAQAQPSGISIPPTTDIQEQESSKEPTEPMAVDADTESSKPEPDPLEQQQQRRRSSRLNAHTATSESTKGGEKEKAPAPAKKAGRKRSAIELTQDEDGADEEEEEASKKAKTTTVTTAGLPLSAPLPSVLLQTEDGREVDSARDLLQFPVSNSASNEGEGEGTSNSTTTSTSAKGVVLFLVPKANTPGCTAQACAFRDHYTEIAQHGFAVYCLSADSPSAQKKWKEKQTLPYGLLSDPKRELIGQLTGKTNKTERSHFIFVDGKLVHRELPVKPKDSQVLALKFIATLEVV